ncbi:mucin-2-like [Mytilus trossulus]|uniref:mucin-2-like n=1 Tax=Mytilus trossulus TaxID=6551 RepID=UPI0030056E60
MEESVVLLEETPVHHSSEDDPPSLQAASDKIGITLSSAKTTSSHPAIRNSASSTELPYLADMDTIADVCLVGSTATVTLGSSSQTLTDQSKIKGSATKYETLPASAHVLSSVSGKTDDLLVTSKSTGINNVPIPKKATCHNEASVSGKASDLTVTSKSTGINNVPIPKRVTCQKEASKHPPVGLSLAVMSSYSSGEYISRITRTFAPPGSSLISSTKHSPKSTLKSVISSNISSTQQGSLVPAGSSSISSTTGTLTSITPTNISSTQQGSLVPAGSISISSTTGTLTSTTPTNISSTQQDSLVPSGLSSISSTTGTLTSIAPTNISSTQQGSLVSAGSSSISSTKHSPIGTFTSITPSNISSTQQGSLVSAGSSSISSTTGTLASITPSNISSTKQGSLVSAGSSSILSTKHSPIGTLTSIISSSEHFSSGVLVSSVSSSISSTKHSTLGTVTSIMPSDIASTEQGSSGSLVSAVSSSIPSTENLTKTEENIMLPSQTEKLSSSQNPTSYKKEHCYTKSSPETMSNAKAMETETETTCEVDTTKRDVEFVSKENEHFAPSHMPLDNSQPSTPTSLDSIMSFSLSNNDSNDGSFYMEVEDGIDNERNDDRENNDGDNADGSHLSAELKTKLSESSDSFVLPPAQSMEKDKISTELSRSKYSLDQPIERTSINNDKDTDKDQSEEASNSTDFYLRFPEITKQLACKFPSLPHADKSCDEKRSPETVTQNTSAESNLDGRETSTAIKQKNNDTHHAPGGTISPEKVKVAVEISSKSRNDNNSQSNVTGRVLNEICIQNDDEIDHGVRSSENEELNENQISKSERTVSFTNPTPVFLFANKNNKKFYQTDINELIIPKDFEDSPDFSLCTDLTAKKNLQTSHGSKTKTIATLKKVSKSLSSTTNVSTEKTTAIKSNNSSSISLVKIHDTTSPVERNIIVLRPTSVVSSTQTTLVGSSGTQTPRLIGNASVFPTCATSLLKSFASDSLKICNTDNSVVQSSKRPETSNVTNATLNSNRPMHSGKYNNNLFRNKNANPEVIVNISMNSTKAGTIVTLNSCGAQNLKNTDSKPTIAAAGHTRPNLSTLLSTKLNVVTAMPSQMNVSTTVPTKHNVANAVPTKPNVANSMPSKVNVSTVAPTKLTAVSAIPSDVNVSSALPTNLNVPTAVRTEIKRKLRPMLIPTSSSNPNANNVQLFKCELPKVNIVRDNDVINKTTVENKTLCYKHSSTFRNPTYTNVNSSGPYHCQLVNTGPHPRVSFSDVNNVEKGTNPNQNPLVITVYPTNYSLSSALIPSSKSVQAKTVQVKTVPAKSAPAKPVPVKSVPANTVPAKSAPAKPVPVKSVPANTVPAKSAPAKTVPAKSAPAKTVQGKMLMQTEKSLLKSPTVYTAVRKLTSQTTSFQIRPPNNMSSQIRPSNIISSSNASLKNLGKLVSVLPKTVHKQTATASAESVLENTREKLEQKLVEILNKTSDNPDVFNHTNTKLVSSKKQMLSTANHPTKCVVSATSPGITIIPPTITIPPKEVIVRPPIIVKVINHVDTQSNNSVSILPKAGGLHPQSTTMKKMTFVSPLKTLTVSDALKHSVGCSSARPLKTTTVTQQLPEMYIRSNKQPTASEQNKYSKTTMVSQDVHYYVENDSTSVDPRDLINQQNRGNISVKLPLTSKEDINLSKVNAASQFSVPIIGSHSQGIGTVGRLATALPTVETSNIDYESNCEENTESSGILIDSVYSLRQNDPEAQNGLSREAIWPKVDKEQIRHFAYQFDCNVQRANVKLDKETKEDDRLREPCFVVLKSSNDGSTAIDSRCSLKCRRPFVKRLSERIVRKGLKSNKISIRKSIYRSAKKQQKSFPVKSGQNQQKERLQKKSSPGQSGQNTQNTKSLSLEPNAMSSAQKSAIVPPTSVANRPGRMLPNPINTVAKVNETITDKQGNKFMMIKLGSKTILIPTINNADKPKAYVLECDPKTSLQEAIKQVTKQHMASFPDKTNTSILSLASSKPSATVTRQTPNTSNVATSSFTGWASASTTSAHTILPMNRVKSEPVTAGYGDEQENHDYTVTVKTEPEISGDRDESKDNDSGPSKSKIARTEGAVKTESASERIKRLRDELKTQEKALEEVRRKRKLDTSLLY